MNIFSTLHQNKNNANLLILLLALFFIIFRHIDFFIYPRFWAEEAAVYFLDAYTYGMSALWHGHQGYYSIIPNFATYFSTLVPLEFAPLVTTIVSFTIQVIPFYLIYKSTSEFLNTSLKKLIFSLIILFTTPTPEVWLNTITSQFHFVVILFLILIDTYNKSNKPLFYTLTLIAGLSGVPSNILAPMFLLRYNQTKTREYLYFFAILFFTTLLQIFFIISSEGPSRVINEYSISDIFNHLLKIYIYAIQYPVAYSDSLVYTVFSLPLVYMLYTILKDNNSKKYFYLFFSSSFLLSTIMLLTSLNMSGGGRYAYAPSVIFILGLYMIYATIPVKKVLKNIALVYISIALLVGFSGYFIIGSYGTKDNSPWKQEVQKYKEHKSDTLAIYPRSWTVTLPRKENN